MLRQDDFVASHLVLEAWRQGCDWGNQQIPCIILGCLTNRVKLGWGTWLDVLQKIPVYSATLVQPNRDKWPNVWDSVFIKLLHLAPAIMDGSMPDPAYGGVYWADTRSIETQWFKEKIMARQDVHSASCNQGPFTVYR